ncbi:hypothetical protein PMM47T1_19913 [Pseudomonas sp. M47T1]|uniref:hypothetical protein n=1 Tax=Pseudomonas sp. M47T1 TaxID=1179778 RepID=UPI00026072DB|nr:hypothetical protein [Pseudomonas sp. M47T1]EIK94797.1 hypothetical protein PMM47T1_19913 [Pseudomonas sp. M47T1]
MINSATGMKPGERYGINSGQQPPRFPGFFLDGKYFLAPELLTAVGWLEGQTFLYDHLDGTGAPLFADRIAGTIENLTLTLADGAQLPIEALENQPLGEQQANEVEDDVQQAPRKAPALLIIVGGVTLGLLCCVLYRRASIHRA